MKNIEPVSGWSLNAVAELDLHLPGAAGMFLRASDERRQVIAALLSVTSLPKCPREAASLASFVCEAGHAEMLTRAYGTAPAGMRRALRRSGPQPHARSYYRLLHKVLSSPKHKSSALVIRQLDRLNAHALLTLLRLPTDIRSAGLVKTIGHPHEAAKIATLLRLDTSSGVDRRSLTEALRTVSTTEQLSRLWERWSRKLVFPPHPIPASEGHVPICNGLELRQAALRYRNCMRDYLPRVMEGVAAFSEFRCGDARAILHLKRRDGLWTLEDVFAYRNRPVVPPLRSAAEDFVREHGIAIPAPRAANVSEWSVLDQFARSYMFDDL